MKLEHCLRKIGDSKKQNWNILGCRKTSVLRGIGKGLLYLVLGQNAVRFVDDSEVVRYRVVR